MHVAARTAHNEVRRALTCAVLATFTSLGVFSLIANIMPPLVSGIPLFAAAGSEGPSRGRVLALEDTVCLQAAYADDAGGQGKFALAVDLFLLWDAHRRIIEVHGDDLITLQGKNVIRGFVRVPPVPAIEDETDLRLFGPELGKGDQPVAAFDRQQHDRRSRAAESIASPRLSQTSTLPTLAVSWRR